jgi:predicted TIM-barrel fold metal-dependent hydrolase
LRFGRTVGEINDFGLKPNVRKKFMRNNAIRLYGLEKHGIQLADEDK